jgi:hypothetical protein
MCAIYSSILPTRHLYDLLAPDIDKWSLTGKSVVQADIQPGNGVPVSSLDTVFLQPITLCVGGQKSRGGG